MLSKFFVGDTVDKLKGYAFPGVVRCAFYTSEQQLRYVVEFGGNSGLLHIFSEEQLCHIGERK